MRNVKAQNSGSRSDPTEGNPFTTYKRRGVNPHRRDALQRRAGSSVLDVGCGSGAYIFEFMGNLNIQGCDYKAFEDWDQCPERFSVCEATDLQFDNETFDTVCSFETLEHIPDFMKALSEFHRVCRKNIIITVPNCEITKGMKESNLIYSHWADPTHCNFFNKKSITQAVEGAGFRISESEYINSIRLEPFLVELFDAQGFLRIAIRWMIEKRLSVQHKITCLIVADKASSL